MEPRNDNSKLNMKLNTLLMNKYKPYKLTSDMISIQDNNKFIGTIYHNNKLLLKFEYTILGSFSKEKNLWVWCDQSLVLDKKMIKKTSDLRIKFSNGNNRITDIFRDFINQNYSVLPISSLYDNLCLIEEITNNYIISTLNTNIITLILINKILLNNMAD